MPENYEKWKHVYRLGEKGPYPWELGRPRSFLVDLVEQGMIRGRKALDTCCGLGTNTLFLAEKGFEVTGIDISERAVEIAREKAERQGKAEAAHFRVQSFMEMDYAAGSFDFVLDIGCFHHIAEEDRRGFIAGVHRVLRAGGRYLLMCFSDRMGPAWNHFSEKQIRTLFSGPFAILRLEEIASVEGDGVTRHFYVSLMEKPAR